MSFWRPDNDKRDKRLNQLTEAAVIINSEYTKNLKNLQRASEKLSQVVERFGNKHESVVPNIPHWTDVMITPIPTSSTDIRIAGQPIKWILSAVGSIGAFAKTAKWTAPGVKSTLESMAIVNLTAHLNPNEAFIIAAIEIETAVNAIAFWTKAGVYAKQGLRWLGRILASAAVGIAINILVDSLFSLWADETFYKEVVAGIKDASEQRLTQQIANNHVKRLYEVMTKYEGSAETLLDFTGSSIDLEKFWNQFLAAVSSTPEARVADAIKDLQEQDTKAKAFTDSDPKIEDYKQTIINKLNAAEKYNRLKSITIKAGWVVDFLQCVSDADYHYMEYGNPNGGNSTVITFDKAERINSLSWQPGTYNGTSVIANFKITTSVKTYGPFGSGSGAGLSLNSEINVNVPAENQVLTIIGQKNLQGHFDEKGELVITPVPFVEDIHVCGTSSVFFH